MQAESFEIQQQYYSECIAKHPNWVLVRIYADEGISATSVKNRKEFNQMIEDCQAGKIDMIITKSVSRFARNVVDCIKYARMLRSLSPPVSIYFETENINTLSQNGELLLTVLAAFAQDESVNKSISAASIAPNAIASGALSPPMTSTIIRIRSPPSVKRCVRAPSDQ